MIIDRVGAAEGATEHAGGFEPFLEPHRRLACVEELTAVDDEVTTGGANTRGAFAGVVPAGEVASGQHQRPGPFVPNLLARQFRPPKNRNC